MSNLISAQTLHQHIQTNNQTLRIIDTRFNLSKPDEGQQHYQQNHIPGAQYFHLDNDLSAPVQTHGGRHPLPDLNTFIQKLESAGISNGSHVVVYDDSAGMIAGRLWWMLKYLGHDNVQVLDGGLSAWIRAGYELSNDTPQFEKGVFTADIQSDKLVDVAYVKEQLDNPDVLLIDARAAARYRGDVEPLDKQAGHIPSALNLPFEDNLKDGMYKPAEELAERYADAEEVEEIIVYCGSGVSATHNLIALAEAGYPHAKLYLGSWSDWSSYENNPVATGDEP